MEQESRSNPLYDFLYRDPDRVASYYSQLFGGHLITAEITSAYRKARSEGGGLSVGIAKGDIKIDSDESEGRKEIRSPHDTITGDLLDRLIQSGYVRGDIEGAPPGSLIHAKGRLSFGDGTAIEQMIGVFEQQFLAGVLSGIQRPTSADKQHAKAVIALVKKLKFPSLFRLEDSSGRLFAGTVKEIGLDVPIPGYYYLHGHHTLSDIHLIGIRTNNSPALSSDTSPLLNLTQEFAKALMDMVLPGDPIRVTPVLIYRELTAST